jgi:hypothetical protein
MFDQNARHRDEDVSFFATNFRVSAAIFPIKTTLKNPSIINFSLKNYLCRVNTISLTNNCERAFRLKAIHTLKNRGMLCHQ